MRRCSLLSCSPPPSSFHRSLSSLRWWKTFILKSFKETKRWDAAQGDSEVWRCSWCSWAAAAPPTPGEEVSGAERGGAGRPGAGAPLGFTEVPNSLLMNSLYTSFVFMYASIFKYDLFEGSEKEKLHFRNIYWFQKHPRSEFLVWFDLVWRFAEKTGHYFNVIGKNIKHLSMSFHQVTERRVRTNTIPESKYCALGHLVASSSNHCAGWMELRSSMKYLPENVQNHSNTIEYLRVL